MQLFEAAISSFNLPYTIVLGLTLVYWLTVFLGALDLDMFDFDVDVDVDADVDVDVDADLDTSGNSGFSWGKLLHYFNIGDVPFMIILSFMALFMWAGSILLNHYLNNGSGLMAIAFFLPLLIVSLFLTKLCSTPFVKMFAAFDKNRDTSVIGAICEVKVGVSENGMGQAEVDTDEFHQLINIKTLSGERLNRGEKAFIIEYNEAGNYYLVDPSSV